MPNIEDLQSRVSEATWFSKLDMNRGFYQIPLEMSSHPKPFVLLGENFILLGCHLGLELPQLLFNAVWIFCLGTPTCFHMYIH